MKRILIDLDILTNAFWKGNNKERAAKFLEDILREKTEILTPSTLINTIFEWNDRKLAKTILVFYAENSTILSKKTILAEIQKSDLDYEKLVNNLVKISVKEEDDFQQETSAWQEGRNKQHSERIQP